MCLFDSLFVAVVAVRVSFFEDIMLRAGSSPVVVASVLVWISQVCSG